MAALRSDVTMHVILLSHSLSELGEVAVLVVDGTNLVSEVS